MNVMLTGSNGFIGKETYHKLKKKHNVKKLIFKKLSQKSLTEIKKKIDKEIKKFKPNIIIHCATFFSKDKDAVTKKKTLKLNFNIPKILIDLAEKNKVQKFVNTGSVHEFLKDRNKFYPYLSSKKKFSNYLKNKKFTIQTFSVYIFNTFGKNDKRKKLLDLIIEQKKSLKIYEDLQLNFLNVQTISSYLSDLCKFKSRSDKNFIYLANKNFFKISSLKNLRLKQIEFIKKPQRSVIDEKKLKVPFKGKFFSSSLDNPLTYIKNNLN